MHDSDDAGAALDSCPRADSAPPAAMAPRPQRRQRQREDWWQQGPCMPAQRRRPQQWRWQQRRRTQPLPPMCRASLSRQEISGSQTRPPHLRLAPNPTPLLRLNCVLLTDRKQAQQNAECANPAGTHAKGVSKARDRSRFKSSAVRSQVHRRKVGSAYVCRPVLAPCSCLTADQLPMATSCAATRHCRRRPAAAAD